jgi:hypothetical protein
MLEENLLNNENVSEPKVEPDHLPRPTAATTKPSPFKFKLSPELESGQFALVQDEIAQAKWTFISTAMSQIEWFVTIVTFGLYYFITRVLLQRKRKYAVHVTNKSVHIKEEMFEKQFFCLKLLMENQVTYPISSLAYVCAEEVAPRLYGFVPTKVACEMRFGRYPVDSQVPITIYRSNLQIMFEPFTIASKFAFQQAFGINFDANPIELVVQLLHAVPLMSIPHMWFVWAGFFGLSLFYQIIQVIRDMTMAALMDPNIGPRQAIGAIDATYFRVEADVSEDPTCQESMRSVLHAIAEALPNRHIVRAGIQPRQNASRMVNIPIGGKARELNLKKKYEDGGNDEYAVPEDYLHLSSTETVYDICPTNPGWSSSDVKRMFLTFGAYYFTDIAGHINHRRNIYFTSHRTIQHSLLIEGSQVTHSRLDFWVADAFTNMAVVHFSNQCTFRANAK